MHSYQSLGAAELQNEYNAVKARFNAFKGENLKIDMSRGKPGADQLDISSAVLMTVSDETGYRSEDGSDSRNYGLLPGIIECRRLFAEIMGLKPENIIAAGNSSLELMFDFVSQCYSKGIAGCQPWAKQQKVKFLCPAPGYDRHFAICEYFGIQMINIPMNGDGPDVELIEEYVADDTVKGMFCVPKYSNPQGIVYSDDVVRAIAALKPSAKDFRIIWDDAYCVHGFGDTPDELLNIWQELAKHGNEDMVVEFTSTSKISYPGAGVSAIGASPANIKEILSRMTIQIISYDKINQLRHARYFKDKNGIIEHMKLHATVLRPKFEAVLDTLERELGGKEIAVWNKPKGGYFISLEVTGGSALRVGGLCREVGLTLTPIGATYPYGIDPNDSNIRIAPTFPPAAELKKAAEVLCVCVRLVCLEELLSGGNDI